MRVPHIVTVTPENTQNFTQKLAENHIPLSKAHAKLVGKGVGFVHRTVEGNADKCFGLAKKAFKKGTKKSKKAKPVIHEGTTLENLSLDSSLASFPALPSSTEELDRTPAHQTNNNSVTSNSSPHPSPRLTSCSSTDLTSQTDKNPKTPVLQTQPDSPTPSEYMTPLPSPLFPTRLIRDTTQVITTSSAQICEILKQLDKEGYFQKDKVTALPSQLDMRLREQGIILPEVLLSQSEITVDVPSCVGKVV